VEANSGLSIGRPWLDMLICGIGETVLDANGFWLS